MSSAPRFTSADLESLLAVDGVRYEMIDGELVSGPPDWHHQYTCNEIAAEIRKTVEVRRSAREAEARGSGLPPHRVATGATGVERAPLWGAAS